MSEMDTHQVPSFRKRLLERVRYFNRQYFNPFALSFAGRPRSFWSVIQHVGRRSGQEYATPIVAVRQDNRFVIPLPYGRQVDWFRNVMATGGCRLIYRGRVYCTSEPEVIAFKEGLAVYPGWVQSLLRGSETNSFLRLNQTCDDPDGDARYKAFTILHPLESGLWVFATLGFLTIGIARLLRRRKR